MAKYKVLIVEDDKTLLDVLKYNVQKEGYDAVTASDGLAALDVARKEKPDLIILDLMLPQLDGLEVCRILRKEMTVPILMLTSKADEIDRVLGLELGADDYVTKPFSMRELLSRIKALFRRTAMVKIVSEGTPDRAEALIQSRDIEIDPKRHTATLRGKALDLGLKEFELLSMLAKFKGQVFSRDQLLEKIWGYEYEGNTRTVDVHVRWLRKKIENDPDKPEHLITVRGVGYKFEE
jgi:two-component system, OmpR family, response regulator